MPPTDGHTSGGRDRNLNTPELLRADLPSGTAATVDNAPQSTFRVGSVLIETTVAVDHSAFENVIEPYLGKDANSAELAKLAQQIADLARANGMLLANSYVPPQQIELGIVRIVLKAGQIDEVRIEGSSNRALYDMLRPLVGKTAMREDLERRLVLASSIPQIDVKQTQILVEEGRQILFVRVEERSEASGRLVIDNFGSKNIGPVRARLSVEGVALLTDSDYMNVTFRTTPAEPQELAAASVTYGVGLGNNGTRAEVAVAWSESEIDARRGTRDASSRYASLAVTHPLRRSRTSNLWIDGQFEYLKVAQDSFGAILQSDSVVTMSVGLSASLKIANGWLRAGTQLRQGLSVFGAREISTPLSSRFDADGRFTSARAWANWSGKPTGDLTLRMAVSGQLANEPLLSSEEIGIGGTYIGRAFDYFERSGDQGALALIEVGYEFTRPVAWIKRLQPYAFFDGGYVDNLGSGFGGGKLFSTGGGIRADIGPLNLQFETAFPVYVTGQSNENSEPTVNLQASLNF